MMTKKISLFLLLSASVMLVVCGESVSSTMPKVAAPYQKSFNEAWEVASQGKVPSNACAVVVGTASSTLKYGKGDKAEAAQAYEACYVDAFVQFANVYIADQNQANLNDSNILKGCSKIFMSLNTHTNALGAFITEFDLDKENLNKKIRAGLSEQSISCLDSFE